MRTGSCQMWDKIMLRKYIIECINDAAQEQGKHRALTAQAGTQLHHEHLRRTHSILLLRQQARGIAAACGEVKATRDFLNSLLIPNSRD